MIRPACGSQDGLRIHASLDEADCAICVAFTAAESLEAERRRLVPILALPVPAEAVALTAVVTPRHLRVVETSPDLETRAC